MSLLCGGVVGDGEVDGELFGFGDVGGFSLIGVVDEFGEELPALPETLPEVPVVLLGEEEVVEFVPAVCPAIPPEFDEVLLALAIVRSSFTFLTPGTDLASFLASFLSALFGTEPVSDTVPWSTLIWTP
jgi:hypothetical protein